MASKCKLEANLTDWQDILIQFECKKIEVKDRYKETVSNLHDEMLADIHSYIRTRYDIT